ncbi:MarR family winged helix-turn-helix transcriptional regulator [Helicobacter cappadocius]|uniref:MarR family winged helix-turn-helix transcriptional regulator n=1 Tax=Helicobacter cappadocius TaxID=3063998 RepID=A0AA90PZ99_9HELI|nr:MULTISPECIES: MarR family winged helix-turn-helix transcriptional regulator [unclassified Helicobacter]MDO7253438.1 MarR family winged helix-turn-helix transcriptional regulator [Helicobacter sp. faydin-H75]MDP2539298.1 MarR family winged helix-turn-helix transcriptional regulator [Helicobacter sp. faydin-H76]
MQEKDCSEREAIPSIILASRQIKNFFCSRLRPYNIGTEEIGILFILKESGEFSITDLSNITLKDKGTVSRTIKSLCRKNLVKKSQEKEDNRITKVSITPEGLEKIEIVKNNKKTFLDVFDNAITSQEKDQLLSILDKITAVMK